MNILSKNQFDDLVNHKGVNMRVQNLYPHIVSFQFTRDIFFSGNWDDISIKARGFFVNKNTREVVARSYDKFFNLGEKPETQLPQLKKNLKFPVQVYVKENGFLGICGYDSETNELFLSSKSASDSDFTEYFKNIFNKLDNKLQQQIRDLCKSGYSCIFEVIDPINDPHLIEYSESHLVLLDVVKRSDNFEKMSYNKLVNLLQYNNHFKCKEIACTLNSWEEFQEWYDNICLRDYKYQNKDVEGFVVEDNNNFQFKVKLGFYSFWKQMRSLKDRVRTIRGTKKPLQRNIESKEASEFYAWCVNQSDDTLNKSIIELRKLYMSSKKQYLALLLSKDSKRELLKVVNPKHKNIYTHHVTLYWDVPKNVVDKVKDSLNKIFDIKINELFEDSKGQAVTVDIDKMFSELNPNQKFHITVSCAVGTPPVYSNDLILNKENLVPIEFDNLVLKGELVVL